MCMVFSMWLGVFSRQRLSFVLEEHEFGVCCRSKTG